MGHGGHIDGSRLSDDLWSRIEPLLPPRKKHPLGCHRPRVPDRRAMEAILFVLRTGCQWRALDRTGICGHSSAYRRFREWAEAGVFLELWARSLHHYDELKNIDWTYLAMDGAITKSPCGGAATGPSPVDRRKIGTKRSLLTDKNGLPLSVVVAGANRNDHLLVGETIASIPISRPRITAAKPQTMGMDRGYDCKSVRALLDELGFTARIHPKPRGKTKADRRRDEERIEAEWEARKKAGAKAQRWVVERTHSWFNNYRRIKTRWERRVDRFEAMLHLAAALVTVRMAGATGQTTS